MAVRRDSKKGWLVDFVFHHAHGRAERVKRKSPVQTKRGAQEHERQLRQELLTPTRKEEVPTLAVFCQEFMQTYVAVNNRPSERAAKQCIFNRHLLPRFGQRRLSRIDVRDLERLKAELVGAGYAAGTTNNILTVLRKTLSYAQEIGILDSVPRFRLLKIPPQDFEFLDYDDYDQLISAQKESDLLVAMLLGGDAGLRRGEINGLQRADINFAARKLTVLRSIWQGREGPPKGGRKRIVPLTDRLFRALKAHRHLGEFVLMEGSRPWTVEMLRARGARAYRLSGLPVPRRPWHCLRHTFCSHLAMRGAAPRTIQELAGHRGIETTMKYMHLAPVELTAAISLLNERGRGPYEAPRKAGTKKASVSASLTDDPTGN